ncbi:MAG: peptide-methionine (S)-S-oxide reductase MsrA [Planctomycetes bacterium]|nr:peptide-methionine (S)-S-oxide reductase MsrA [Planctomycetota bacterium]
MSSDGFQTATLGGGCFWCTEAVFRELRGVQSVVSGYCGGGGANPSYKQVCSGDTGHAEAIQVRFDPSQVSFAQLLEVFFKTHDPTTRNRQGNDVGTQYRSVIFHHDDPQLATAQDCIRRLDAAGAFSRPIVTTCEPYRTFYPAEHEHQEFYERNPWQPYCIAVIRPKIDKFREAFAELLRS